MIIAGVAIIGLIIGIIIGVAIDEFTLGKSRHKAMMKSVDTNNKFAEFYKILLQWLKLHQNCINIADYLRKCGYKRVAVYGMKELGVALLKELKDSNVEVAYAIDRDADNVYVPADVYRPDEELEPVDAVIVTAVHYFDSIKGMLEKKMTCPIISLEDVVWNAEKK